MSEDGQAPEHAGVVARTLTRVDAVIVRILWWLRVLAALVIMGMMLTTAYDVVSRYAFAAPTEWALTLNAAAVLAATFFAVPHLAVVNGHIGMDLLYRRMGPSGRRVAGVVTGVATLAFGVCMAWLGYRAMLTAYVSGLFTSGNFALPLWTLYATVYIGGVGLVLAVVLSPWRRRGDTDTEGTPSTHEGVS